ncbi:conserved hypothetical protein [Magnetospirillum sp. LM-5]|uniref:DUF262 domain-containing protein n=1 Tax=Magnetospirillum sp. LM-5 TaxID=2681466 RepID=UPI001382B755|nr:DUF262 domain-containing protein [Magnetospirillum sp. LM-5]CAA7619146.1 conserved hypothetical protein [Magnetospirillum sp. LM-5]
MENDLRFQVRSREIVDLYSAMRNARLILTPYFQRNLVWRDAHKRDFIDTILKGYPFPQIFLARGPIDLETMEAYQCVVDGQQRLNTIREFIEGKLDVDGKQFSDLTPKEKEGFLKYEIAVIDFDLDAGDPRLKEIFHRLNRTYYSLSAIEKIASEYSASEFLLVARVLCGEITKQAFMTDDELIDVDDSAEEGDPEANSFARDPGIDEGAWNWLLEKADGPFAMLIQNRAIFTRLEFDRKVPLMFTLNIMCTYLSGYYNRNDKVRKFLEDKNSEFHEKEEVINALNEAAGFIHLMDLPNDSMWWNKANFFSLVCELSRNTAIKALGAPVVGGKLLSFANAVPQNYSLAAREAVGRKSQRELRGSAIRTAILGG